MKLLQIVFLQHTKVIIKDKKKNQRERERERERELESLQACNLSSTPGSAPVSPAIIMNIFSQDTLNHSGQSEYNKKTKYISFTGKVFKNTCLMDGITGARSVKINQHEKMENGDGPFSISE